MKQQFVGFVISYLAVVCAQSVSAVEWRDGDRVVLIGNTFIERAQSYGHLETVLTANLADRAVSFRNLGWSGDTVYGDARSYFGPPEEGFERLSKHLDEIKPTIIVSAYGAVAAFDGPSGLQSFLTGYARLLDMMVAKSGARVVLMSPPPLENLGSPLPNQDGQNRNLALYRDGIKELAQQRGHDFADLFEALGAGRLANRRPFLTENGVHYTEQGYAEIAPILAKLLGAVSKPESIDAKFADAEKAELHILPASWAAREVTIKVSGLKPGDYTLKASDGRSILTASDAVWSAGTTIQQGLWSAQYDRLREAVIAKNQQFFHRWRPANETYLFGFRKHEQGNNAVEMPQFDPLVAALEAKILQLRQSQPVVVTLTKRSSN